MENNKEEDSLKKHLREHNTKESTGIEPPKKGKKKIRYDLIGIVSVLVTIGIFLYENREDLLQLVGIESKTSMETLNSIDKQVGSFKVNYVDVIIADMHKLNGLMGTEINVEDLRDHIFVSRANMDKMLNNFDLKLNHSEIKRELGILHKIAVNSAQEGWNKKQQINLSSQIEIIEESLKKIVDDYKKDLQLKKKFEE